jgi:uncharacterized membrane protein
MQKLNGTGRSMKMMRGGMTFALLAVVLAIGGVGAGALLLIPCVLTICAVMRIMMRGGGGARESGSASEPETAQRKTRLV